MAHDLHELLDARYTAILTMESVQAIAAALVLSLVYCAACDETGFRFSVSFRGPVEIERGADVRYQGIPVGSVERVSLRQEVPDRPARVILELVVSEAHITVRTADQISIESEGLLGDSYVLITASDVPSRALLEGTTVPGREPLLTRLGESASHALEWWGELADEQKRLLLEAFRQSAPQPTP